MARKGVRPPWTLREARTHPSECLKAKVVTLDGLDAMGPREPSISIHDEGHVLRDGPLSQRTDHQAAQLLDSPFGWWRRQKPSPGSGQMEGRHPGSAKRQPNARVERSQ